MWKSIFGDFGESFRRQAIHTEQEILNERTMQQGVNQHLDKEVFLVSQEKNHLAEPMLLTLSHEQKQEEKSENNEVKQQKSSVEKSRTENGEKLELENYVSNNPVKDGQYEYDRYKCGIKLTFTYKKSSFPY